MPRKHETVEEDGMEVVVTPRGKKIYPDGRIVDTSSVPIIDLDAREAASQAAAKLGEMTPEEELARALIPNRVDQAQMDTTIGYGMAIAARMFQMHPGLEKEIAEDPNRSERYRQEVLKFGMTMRDLRIQFEEGQTLVAQQNAYQEVWDSVGAALRSRLKYQFAPQQVKDLVDMIRANAASLVVVDMASKLSADDIELGAQNLARATDANVKAAVARLSVNAMVKAQEQTLKDQARATGEIALAKSKAARESMEIETRKSASEANREAFGGYLDVLRERTWSFVKEGGETAQSLAGNVVSAVENAAVRFGFIAADQDKGLIPRIGDAFTGLLRKVSVPVVGGVAIGGAFGFAGGLEAGVFLSNAIGASSMEIALANPAMFVPVLSIGIGGAALGGWVGSWLEKKLR